MPIKMCMAMYLHDVADLKPVLEAVPGHVGAGRTVLLDRLVVPAGCAEVREQQLPRDEGSIMIQ